MSRLGVNENCDMVQVHIPDSVELIPDGAFEHFEKLEKVFIPASVTSIGRYVFAYCHSLKEIIVDPANPVYSSPDGCNAIIETATRKLIAGCGTTIIPETVVEIGNGAFYGIRGMKEMVIPKNVQRMEDDVFYDCTDLEKVSILGPVACIRQQVFCYCLSLKTVEFGHGIGEIQTCICLNTPDEILVPQGAGQYYKDRLFPTLHPLICEIDEDGKKTFLFADEEVDSSDLPKITTLKRSDDLPF